MAVVDHRDQSARSGEASSRRRWLVLGAVVAVAAGALWWWLAYPRPFMGYQDVTALGPGKINAGETYHFDTGVVLVEGAPVELISVTPRFSEESQRTIAWAISLCEGGPEGSVGNFPGDLLPFCSAPRPAAGATFDGSLNNSECGDRCDQMVMTIAPLTAGPVAIDGWDVKYRAGARSVSQRVGDNVRLTAVP